MERQDKKALKERNLNNFQLILDTYESNLSRWEKDRRSGQVPYVYLKSFGLYFRLARMNR